MFFPDLALARRLERHEAWSSAAHAHSQAQLYPQTGAAVQPVGEGYAVFCGQKSPLNQAYGLGLSGPVDAADLDAVEAFYRQRKQPVRIRVCPLADPTLLALLCERGYGVQGFMNVYVRPVAALEAEPPPVAGLTIKVASADEARDWFEQEGAGGDWAEPDGITFMTIRCTLKSDTRLFLAWRAGQPVGGGALEIHAGMAALMAAGTRPGWRKQGVHTALLRARLAAASAAGCDLAMVHSEPGAVSQHTILRAGFQLAYTSVSGVRMLSS